MGIKLKEKPTLARFKIEGTENTSFNETWKPVLESNLLLLIIITNWFHLFKMKQT
jgi:hypothetical protein